MYTCNSTSNYATSVFECTLYGSADAARFLGKERELATVTVQHDMYSDNEAASFLNLQADTILGAIKFFTNKERKSLYAGDLKYIKIENKVISVVFEDYTATY